MDLTTLIWTFSTSILYLKLNISKVIIFHRREKVLCVMFENVISAHISFERNHSTDVS